ncbi:MAG TPA: VCBS repeat-containing protein [Phycisphaerales bacterium]|nr:VCBS repeat-containing protein [Phycisphaerales bacterium]
MARVLTSLSSFTLLLALASASHGQITFIDATQSAGLANITAGRLCFADLNKDRRPDAIIRALESGKPDRYRVFLNTPREPDAANAALFTFIEHDSALPTPIAGDCLVFADLNNDDNTDAIMTRYVDVNKATEQSPLRPERTGYMLGKGDGTFADYTAIPGVTPATTSAIAVGDIDRDGSLDLYLGNWYSNYGESVGAFENELVLSSRNNFIGHIMVPEPGTLGTTPADDAGARPTYGVMVVQKLLGQERVRAADLLELNYGRRANRVWCDVPSLPEELRTRAESQINSSMPERAGDIWWDATPDAIAGDADRSGIYPDWLTERAKTDPRFARENEEPFRSHGNTFDAAVGDIDNDGDFDLFLTEITHAWAGPSSDRSRFIVQNTTRSRDADGTENVSGHFVVKPELSVDRIPSDPTIRNWNQGDLFAELCDFDHDGRLDLLLSSGDYPDDERLRIYRQQLDGTFQDITPYTGINNEGSQQVSLADVDLDGDMDVLVGQSFNRLSAAQIAGRTPTVKLYLNQTVERRRERTKTQLPLTGVETNSLTLILQGDPAQGCTRDALGAIVRITADLDNDPATPDVTQTRQLIGIGGHAGKQHEFIVQAGLASATNAVVEVSWPTRDNRVSNIKTTLTAGRHILTTPPAEQP